MTRSTGTSGTRTIVFAPGAAEQRVIGNDMMSSSRLDEVIQQSFICAGRQAAAPDVRTALRAAAAAGGHH